MPTKLITKFLAWINAGARPGKIPAGIGFGVLI
jgi:hypothetical protein